jgi:hypothetical protein
MTLSSGNGLKLISVHANLEESTFSFEANGI